MEKQREHHFLYFTKREKNGIVLVVLINLFICFLPDLFEIIRPSKNEVDTEVIEDLKRLVMIKDSSDSNNDVPADSPTKEREYIISHYKKFDPNTITQQEWLELGIKPKTAETIKKYISKGGHFYKPEDLKKIWGIPPQKCDELIPYVVIQSDVSTKEFKTPTMVSQKKEYPIRKQIIIDINAADSASIESLPGIGPTLTRRIIAYRLKLGGFFEKEQLKEVWGLPDSVYQKIKESVIVSQEVTQKININTASYEQLKVHPYIGYKIAGAIINFRNQHGSFKSLEDIQKIILISDDIFNKIKHYLVVS